MKILAYSGNSGHLVDSSSNRLVTDGGFSFLLMNGIKPIGFALSEDTIIDIDNNELVDEDDDELVSINAAKLVCYDDSHE